jgi:hypothetical protein
MAWSHGSLLFRIAAALVLASSFRSPEDWKDAVVICKVQAPSSLSGVNESLQVVALPGNWRAVAFGEGKKDVETTVHCMSDGSTRSNTVLPAGCTAWTDDQEPVNDVSMCPSCPCTQDTTGGLQSASNAMLFQVGIEPACRKAEAGSPVDVLLFGMGGGAVQTYTVQHCPEHTRVESVEADARMAAIATKFFGVPVRDGVSVVDVDDASAAASSLAEQLNAAEAPMEHTAGRLQLGLLRGGRQNGETALGKKRWDVVITDCFADKGVVPEGCRSREFLTYLRLLVRPGGTVLHHMWHTSPYDDSVAPTFDDTLQLYKDTFGEGNVAVRSVPREKGAEWDSVILVRG